MTQDQIKRIRNLIRSIEQILEEPQPRKTGTRFFLMDDPDFKRKIIVFKKGSNKGRTFWPDGDIGPLGFWKLHEMTSEFNVREVTREEALKTVKQLPQ